VKISNVTQSLSNFVTVKNESDGRGGGSVNPVATDTIFKIAMPNFKPLFHSHEIALNLCRNTVERYEPNCRETGREQGVINGN
jgi:hypothetical protein